MLLLADVGIPMLAVVWPVAWLAFLPVVLIESLVALKSLQLRFPRALVVTAAANAVSTLVGIPVTWFVAVILLGFVQITVGHSLWHANDTLMQAVLAASTQAAWLGPYTDPGRMIPIAAILLCIPFYFASVWIEYRVARRMVDSSPRQILRFSWWANLWSYMAIVLFWMGCLLTADPSTASLPRTTSQEAAMIAGIEESGGRVNVYYGGSDRSAIMVRVAGPNAGDTTLERLKGLAQRIQMLSLDAEITDAGLQHIAGLTVTGRVKTGQFGAR